MKTKVTVIVPTKNSQAFLERCLTSIRHQTLKEIELIVVDNHSTDSTPEIASRLADAVLTLGPERSAQRNAGVKRAVGEFVLICDSDMILQPSVLEECVSVMESDVNIEGVIIPERSIGNGWWAKTRALERSFYEGVAWMEAARFFRKETYVRLGGYNEKMVSGEDWDLSQRIASIGKIARSASYILHDEGAPTFLGLIRKKYYYAGQFAKYVAESTSSNIPMQTSILGRYRLFFSRPRKLFADPLLGLSVIALKTSEFAAGAVGLIASRIKKV